MVRWEHKLWKCRLSAVLVGFCQPCSCVCSALFQILHALVKSNLTSLRVLAPCFISNCCCLQDDHDLSVYSPNCTLVKTIGVYEPIDILRSTCRTDQGERRVQHGLRLLEYAYNQPVPSSRRMLSTVHSLHVVVVVLVPHCQ